MGSKLLFSVESLMFGTGLIVKCTRLIHMMIYVIGILCAVVLNKTVNIADLYEFYVMNLILRI